jgi:hypothetical protein
MSQRRVIDPIPYRCRPVNSGKPSPASAIDGLGDLISITTVTLGLYYI